jgi:hypothetical protein
MLMWIAVLLLIAVSSTATHTIADIKGDSSPQYAHDVHVMIYTCCRGCSGWLTRAGATHSRAFSPLLWAAAPPHVVLLKLHVTLSALRLWSPHVKQPKSRVTSVKLHILQSMLNREKK